MLIRLVQPADLDALVALAKLAGVGLTTLPADAELLQRRILASQAGNAPLLVLHDGHGRLIGTAGLCTHVGDPDAAEPFYVYRRETAIHRSDALNVTTRVESLHLVAEYEGPAEVGTLFLHPDHRGSGLGKTLSRARLLYLAEHREAFAPQLVAEIRGVVDAHGRSPFWDALGRHFFQVAYTVADTRSARDKRFIAELMPRHPIYLPLLSPEARAVVGVPHPEAVPAMKSLLDEGMYPTRMVDIFDAGPMLQCDRDALRTVREQQQVTVEATTDTLDPHDPQHIPHALIAAFDPRFATLTAPLIDHGQTVTITQQTAQQLQLTAGSRLRWVNHQPHTRRR